MSTSDASSNREEPLLDTLLRDALPEIKLALGELIDRENARALPDRYHRFLPESTLAVALRPDAADALDRVAAEVERELSESCTRHGSLYDRVYRVRLRRAERSDGPLFRVAVQPESAGAPEPAAPAPAPATPMPLPVSEPAPREVRVDPDATRVEGAAPPSGWRPGHWVLVVEDEGGNEQTTHPLREPTSVVGRRSDDPEMRPTVALEGAPHVSRRQLALVWEPRRDEPGFRVYNLGLNALHLDGTDIPGAKVGREPLRLDALAAPHRGWLRPGAALRIGESGPTLRIREAEPPARDPDATVLG